MRISDIPIELRPREKAIRVGIENLSNLELLTLLIGSGGRGNSAIDIADELLKSHNYSLESLVKSDYSSLSCYLGLKKSITMRLLATFEFHNRLNSPYTKTKRTIETSNDAYLRYKYLENLDQEVMVVIMLDSKRRIIKEKVLYKGTFDSFSIDVRQVIQEVVLAKAKYFMLIHNHPDEEKEASENDIMATKVIDKNAKTIGIKLLDHIIIFKGGMYSIKNKQNELI